MFILASPTTATGISYYPQRFGLDWGAVVALAVTPEMERVLRLLIANCDWTGFGTSLGTILNDIGSLRGAEETERTQERIVREVLGVGGLQRESMHLAVPEVEASRFQLKRVLQLVRSQPKGAEATSGHESILELASALDEALSNFDDLVLMYRFKYLTKELQDLVRSYAVRFMWTNRDYRAQIFRHLTLRTSAEVPILYSMLMSKPSFGIRHNLVATLRIHCGAPPSEVIALLRILPSIECLCYGTRKNLEVDDSEPSPDNIVALSQSHLLSWRRYSPRMENLTDLRLYNLTFPSFPAFLRLAGSLRKLSYLKLRGVHWPPVFSVRQLPSLNNDFSHMKDISVSTNTCGWPLGFVLASRLVGHRYT